MAGLPLQRYELFHSSNIAEASEHVGRILAPHRLELAKSTARLNARMHTRRLNTVAVSYLAYGSEVRLHFGEFRSSFAVVVPLSGSALIRCGGQEVFATPNVAAVISPHDPVSMRWSDECAALVLRIEGPALESDLRDLVGTPLVEPLRFQLEMQLGRPERRSWLGAFRCLVEDLDRTRSAITSHRLVAARFEDWLLAALLLVQSHNYSDMLADQTHAPVSSRAVALARELIDSHPEWPYTVADLARAASVSVRGLQIAFASHLNTTPKEYLTRVRMERARDQLRAAQPGSVSVQQIAARWGFNHAGRFASNYRRRFGELPSQTLAR